jgi:hypothetical protein
MTGRSADRVHVTTGMCAALTALAAVVGRCQMSRCQKTASRSAAVLVGVLALMGSGCGGGSGESPQDRGPGTGGGAAETGGQASGGGETTAGAVRFVQEQCIQSPTDKSEISKRVDFLIAEYRKNPKAPYTPEPGWLEARNLRHALQLLTGFLETCSPADAARLHRVVDAPQP